MVGDIGIEDASLVATIVDSRDASPPAAVKAASSATASPERPLESRGTGFDSFTELLY
jgi:hypothetical protein